MQFPAEVMKELQFDQWGICAFDAVLPLLEVRSKNRIPADAASIIVILFGYYTEDYPDRNVSRYAIVDDYHTVINEKLHQLVENLLNRFKTHWFIPFVDSSPVPEVRAAILAGLGESGMNGQLLNAVYGSRCFIGEVITDIGFPQSPPVENVLCTRCGRCLAACPTGALSENGFSKARCRSYITQKKGELTPWEQEQIRQGGFAWGCDCCTDACPVNARAAASRVPEFYRDIEPRLGEDNVGTLCGTKAYGWRGENLLLRNLRLLQK